MSWDCGQWHDGSVIRRFALTCGLHLSTIGARTHNTTTIKAIENGQAWSGHRTIGCLLKSETIVVEVTIS